MVGAGADLSGTFTLDYLGNIRSDWDAGAIEYQPASGNYGGGMFSLANEFQTI